MNTKIAPSRLASLRGTCEALLDLGIRPTPEDALGLAQNVRELLEALEQTVKERDELFLEVGKYHNIPTFEYWKERAEKAEAECAVARERLGPAGYKILTRVTDQSKVLSDTAAMLEHAIELGHLGEGSTKRWARDQITAIEKLVGKDDQ